MSDVTELGNLTKIKGGSGFPEIYQGNSEGNYPFIKVSDMNLPENEKNIVNSNNYVDEGLVKKLGLTIFPADTIVFAKVGAAVYLNKRRKLTKNTIIDNNMMGIIPTDIDSEYLYQLMLMIDLGEYTLPGVLPSINQQIISQIKIHSLPLAAQQKIAKVLTTIDKLIEKTQALLDKYTAIKQGMMADLFTRGIDLATGQLRPPIEQAPHLYKESELGWIPNDWDVGKLGGYVSKIEQGWSPDCMHEPATQGNWGVLKTTAVVWDGFSGIENKALPTNMTPRKEYEVFPGDVLITRAGPGSRVGVVAYVKTVQEKLMLSDKLYRIKTNEKIEPEYLSLLLSSNQIQSQLDGKKTGLAESQSNISQGIIKKLSVFIPTIDEQDRIVNKIDTIYKKINYELKLLHKLKLKKNGLMQDLLTGKVPIN